MKITLNITDRTASVNMRYVARAIRFARDMTTGDSEWLECREQLSEVPTIFAIHAKNDQIEITEQQKAR